MTRGKTTDKMNANESTEGPLLTINRFTIPLELYQYKLGWGTTYLLGVGLTLKKAEVNMFRTFTNKELCANLSISYANLMRFKRKLRKRGFLTADGILLSPEEITR